MTITEFIFGREHTKREHKILPLMHTGFSREEALNLAYIYQRLNAGKICGLITAIGAYTLTMRRKPFKLNKSRNMLAGAVAAGSSAFVVDYLFRYDRTAGNTFDSNLYTNQLYNSNKRQFARNYEDFNRRFTPEEIEQFLFNEKLRTFGRKNFVHNEHVHPPLEEHQVKHNTYNDGVWYFSADIHKRINTDNAEKILDGEIIKMKPFVLLDHVDYTGMKLGAVSLGTLSMMKANL